MSFIPIPNGISLCFDFSTDTQNWQFCLTLKKSAGAPTPTDLAAVAAIGHDWWTDELKPITSAATTCTQVVATDQTAQGAPQASETVGTAGDDAAAGLPSGSPMCVSLRTAKRGRSYRGRIYASGRTVAERVSINYWSTTAVANMVDAVSTLQTTLDTAGFDIVVASKRHNGVTTNPAETNEVVSIVADSTIDSQRRRLGGRGT